MTALFSDHSSFTYSSPTHSLHSLKDFKQKVSLTYMMKKGKLRFSMSSAEIAEIERT